MSEGSEARLLARRYRLRERLGRGGMATVYRATDELLGRDVAVKLLDLHTNSDQSAAARFRREARATAALSHRNIVTLFDTGLDGDDAFLVMELLPGPTLAEELRERSQLPVSEVIRIGIQVGNALAAAHAAGIVHRDIKPGNIARSTEGDVKVLDFGIIQLLDDSLDTSHGPLTIPDSVIGTAQFLSPEQAMGKRVDHRADLYALGCVCFALLTGKAPFRGDTAVATLMLQATAPPPEILDLRPEIPDSLADLIRQLLEKEPSARPGSAREVVERLRRISTQVATSPLPTTSGLNARTAVLPVATGGLSAAAAGADLGIPMSAGPPSQAGSEPPAAAQAPRKDEPSRLTSRLGPIAIVLALALLAAAGGWALLKFQPGVDQSKPPLAQETPTIETSKESPPAELTTKAPPPVDSLEPSSTQTSPSLPPTTTAPSPVETPPSNQVSSTPSTETSPVGSTASLDVVEASTNLAQEVEAAVLDGIMTKEDRKAVFAGLRDLDKGLKQEDTQTTSDALSAVDQALSDSDAQDKLDWWYTDLKTKVDTWADTIS